MKIAVAGEGAFGTAHLEALRHLEGAEVELLIGDDEANTRRTAEAFGIKRWTTNFTAGITDYDIKAVILATPTPMHANQAIECLEAGKHVLVEIPMSDTLVAAERLVATKRRTGLIAMAGHIRRFNYGHNLIHKRIVNGELTLKQLITQTYFLRRTNINLLGKPRTWTDSLLWHHACHSVDLFLYQTQEEVFKAHAIAGALSPSLGIPLDMGIQLQTPSGVIASTSLSFNHEGPPGSVFRYICEQGTFIVKNDEMSDGEGGDLIPKSTHGKNSGLQAMDQNFISAIQGLIAPKASVEQCLPAMRVLDLLERQLQT